jgi:hypothetical protein
MSASENSIQDELNIKMYLAVTRVFEPDTSPNIGGTTIRGIIVALTGDVPSKIE